MSVYATMFVWETSNQKSTSLLALLAIADYADEETGEAFPGITKLSSKLRMKERNTQTLLRKIEAEGELLIDENKGVQTSTGRTNRYTLVGYREWYKEVQKIASLRKQGVQVSVTRGASFGSQGVQELAPNPSVEPSIHPSDKDSAPAARLNLDVDAVVPNPPSKEHSPKGEKTWGDMNENERIAALIKVWVDSNGILVSKSGKASPYGNKGYRTYASILVENNITPAQLQDFIDEKKGDAFWDGKNVGWKHIVENIGTWADVSTALNMRSDDYPPQSPDEPHEPYVPPPPEAIEAMNRLRESFGIVKVAGQTL
jgi:hypothetical protein